MYFCRAKVPKRPAHGRNSRSLLLLVNCLVGNILVRSSLAATSLSVGSRVLRNLICTAIQEKLYPRKSSNSPRTMACCRQGSTLFCLRCRFLINNTIVHEKPNLVAHQAILKLSLFLGGRAVYGGGGITTRDLLLHDNSPSFERGKSCASELNSSLLEINNERSQVSPTANTALAGREFVAPFLPFWAFGNLNIKGEEKSSPLTLLLPQITPL